MKFDILTLFPDLVDRILGESIIGRARTAGIIEVKTHQIRDFAGHPGQKLMCHRQNRPNADLGFW